MTATADVERGIIYAVVEIAAPPERVFRALTTPSELAAWWGSDDTYHSYDWTIDLRVGGQWSSQTRSVDGGTGTVRGEYLAIDPPRLLEYTWLPSWEDFRPSTVRCELEPTATGTRLTMTHSGFEGRASACEGHAAGWNRVLGWLTSFVEESPTSIGTSPG